MMPVKYLHKFNSWSEYLTAAHADTVGRGEAIAHSSTKDDDDWCGSSVEEWPTLERLGWDAVYPEIKELTDEVTDDLRPLLAETFVKRMGVKGHKVEMGRFLSGSPVCMSQIKPIKVATVGRVVTILVNGGFSAGVDTADVKRRGVAICALVEALNLMQHSTEIWVEIPMGATSGKHEAGSRHVTLFKLKSAEDELDMARLMYVIAHPSALRRTWFSFVESLPYNEFAGFLGTGYGSPAHNTQAEAVEATIDLPKLEYPFPNSLQWVKDHLSKFGLLEGKD